MSTMRRSQSLRSLSGSGGQDRSWVRSSPSLWDYKKSVSQLVQQYQSCVELSSYETDKEKQKVHLSFRSTKEDFSETRVDSPWRRSESWGNHADLMGPGSGSSSLSRSRSMDYLPQRNRTPEGIRALRALFESKAAVPEDRKPRQNEASPASRVELLVAGYQSTEKAQPQGARSSYNTGGTTGQKENTVQRTGESESRRTVSVPESSFREIRAPHPGDRRCLELSYRDSLSRQGRDRNFTSNSVRDRSALYLSRVAAAEYPGSLTHTEPISYSGKKTKASKMANIARQIRVSEACHEDDDLPLPPPIPPKPQYHEESPAGSSSNQDFLPIPPPKETFSMFYQQRQKNELKRLFKHIHPDLRDNINDVVDDEFVEVMQSEGAQTAADAGYQGEVQSMRWIFENWTLGNIGDHPHMTKKLVDEESQLGGDVRGTSSMFEHCMADDAQQIVQRQSSVRGDVRTSTWLFETQPMDSLNKIKQEEGELVEAVLKEPIQTGDVKGARVLFETKPLDTLGRCCSVEDQQFLMLKSELQEQKGDVRKTLKLFQADPCCALRDTSGNIHEIKSICREEISSSNVSTARWLFETKPVDVINKGPSEMQIIRGISLEELQKGGVDRKRWMFETQPISTIQEDRIDEDRFEGTVVDIVPDADVGTKLKLFETQPLAALRGQSTEGAQEKEEILGGNVKSSLWLFETQPMETLKDSYEVGHLKKVTLSANEVVEVKGTKDMFQNYDFRKDTSDGAVKESISRDHGIEKCDVKSYKHLFETIPLCNISQSKEEVLNGKTVPFEETPLYAIKDCSGNFHEVTTVSREESIKGTVQNYRWMFETKPLDQFDEGTNNIEVIKGITRQEDRSGDVKMAKWLFETQTIDGIHSKFNQSDQQNSIEKQEEPRKGNVKTCKWLFETQPMDILYDKSEKILDKEQAIENPIVKSVTWLFESQPLDSIKESEEQRLKLCSTISDGVMAEVGVKTVKHLFETETLDRIRKDTDSKHDVRYVSEVHVQSGDVSRVKDIFETKSLDEIGFESLKFCEDESIQKGAVHKCTWLFENHPINLINDKDENATTVQQVNDVEGGDVDNKKFIFETFSLDKIHDKDELSEHTLESVEEPLGKVNVKSSTMLFESQPLYALKDKEGHFHEVTTVQKEEVMSGDVRGARWMFETKPLDAIQAEKDIYVIRAVTQEDVKTGDVNSARWKFETQPLDSLTVKEEQEQPAVVIVEDFGSCNVKLNKQLFESDQSASKKYVRMVSVTDVQQGDVRTSTWLFENQPLDCLKGEPEEKGPVQTVHREDNQKGEVKRCTWLFESQPLDKIKEAESNTTAAQTTAEEISQTHVKSTTWLFETTPIDKIVTTESVGETLARLHQLEFIHSSGILIESHDITNVNMVKYHFSESQGAQIQKEETVEGNLKNIMLQLLSGPTLKPQITLLNEEEQGKVHTTVLEIPIDQPALTTQDKDDIVKKMDEIIESMLVQNKLVKKGIIMQESEGGHAEMTVYSLRYQTKTECQDITKGDVKSTIGNLLASANNPRTSASCTLDEKEKGNVNLYRSCIEKGDLQKLKSLQVEQSEIDELYLTPKEQIEILQGDVKGAKKNLQKQKDQVERTISDVLPGDVKNAKKVFSTEGSIDINVANTIPNEEIIRGDILTAKQQLALTQNVSVEKEDIVPGDIKATLQSLERAKQQSMHVEREVITPGTIYDMDLATQGPDSEGNQAQKEEIVSGDVKAAKQSLEMAKNQSLRVDRDIAVPGKIYNVNVTSEEQSSTTVRQSTSSSSSRSHQITSTFRKVSDTEGDREKTENCQQGDVSRSADVIHVSAAGSPPAVSCSSSQNHPFVNSEFNEIERTDVADAVGGDVKAAIRSLNSHATEYRLLEKEDIVRGNMSMALRSLERSSINVSKGDYKAAMLYRNSGNAGSSRKRDAETVKKLGVVVSMSPSDCEMSPLVSVTSGDPPAIPEQTSEAVTLTGHNEIYKPFPKDAQRPTLSPPKVNEKSPDLKPALPPKPQRLQHIHSDATQNTASSSITCKHQSPVIPAKMNQGNSCPPLPQKHLPNRQQTTKDSQLQLTSKETTDGKSNKIPAEVTRAVQMEKKNIGTTLYNQTITVDQGSTHLNGTQHEMDKNVIQKINAEEEIRRCMQSFEKDGNEQQENIMGFQVALQNFEGKEKNVVEKAHMQPKKINLVEEKVSLEQSTKTNTNLKDSPVYSRKYSDVDLQKSLITTEELPITKQNKLQKEKYKTVPSSEVKDQDPTDKVVLRKKKGKKETDEQRLQRLSVHKDEIMRGNVKAAMEIFENLRKREELKTILSQVQEIEGETCEVDVHGLKTLFENVPAWIVTPCKNTKKSHLKGEKNVETESAIDDLERETSVETVFGNLEKASKEILHLKEQTLAKLIDIEEAIKKALYSVSNLKSEADIAGLSGLFNESLKTEQSCQPTNNIRKICIVSSKASTVKTEQIKETSQVKRSDSSGPAKTSERTSPSPALQKPQIKQCQALPSSPSFISIHSAARKPADLPTSPQQFSTFKPNPEGCPSPNRGSPKRKVSVLEVQTVPDTVPAGIFGTKTVSEKYEETDRFGNTIVSSTTSTFVTKQSENFGVVTSPTRYEVVTSPLRRSGHPFSENAQSNAKEDGSVFVTFGQPGFQSPAKEMCSACLTPVYPMEKMVANKLVLHNNCFCCKHCKKKLSICNYSALYGEFYCTFHYEQLFKRKGNYDEGFGHQQHKDRWRPKSKEPEPDNTNYKTKDKKTLKASTGSVSSKANVSVDVAVDGLAEPSSSVLHVTAKSVRSPMSNSSPDRSYKQKHSWPPSKKGKVVSSPCVQQVITLKTQRIHVETDKSTQDKIINTASKRSEIAKSDVTDSLRTPDFERARPWSVSSKRTLFQQESVTPLKTVGTAFDTITTKQSTQQVKLAPAAMTHYSSVSDEKTNSKGKTKKTVRFSPCLGDNLNTSASELISGTRNDDQSAIDSIESRDKGTEIKQCQTLAKAEERDIQGKDTPNIYEYKCPKNIQNSYDDNSNEKLELNETHLEGSQGSIAENVDIGITLESTQFEGLEDVKTNSELSGLALDVIESDVVQINTCSTPELKTTNLPEPGEYLDIKAGRLEESHSVDQKEKESEPALNENNRTNNKNLVDCNDQVKQENMVDLPQGVKRSNSITAFVKQKEKIPTKKGGSWSSRKSPLSKLFISGGNEKNNKTEGDIKKPDAKPRGILGKLFQSSMDKGQDSKNIQDIKTGFQEEGKETLFVQTEDTLIGDIKSEPFEREDERGDQAKFSLLEKPMGQSNENSFSANPNLLDNVEMKEKHAAIQSAHSLSVVDSTGDILGATETTHMPSGDISSVVEAEKIILFAEPDPTSPLNNDMAVSSKFISSSPDFTVNDKMLEASVNEISNDLSLSDPASLWSTADDPFDNDIINIGLTVPLSNQTNPDASHLTNQMFIAQEVKDLDEGHLFDLFVDVSQKPPDLFQASQTQEETFCSNFQDTVGDVSQKPQDPFPASQTQETFSGNLQDTVGDVSQKPLDPFQASQTQEETFCSNFQDTVGDVSQKPLDPFQASQTQEETFCSNFQDTVGDVSQKPPDPFQASQTQEEAFSGNFQDTSSTVSLSHELLSADSVGILESQLQSTRNHDIFGIGDKMTVPDQAWQTEIVATQQDPTKIPHLFDLSTATPTKVLSNQSDVDIFDKDQDATSPVQLSASSMFGQDGADLTLSHPAPSIFSDDILGIGDNSFSGDPQRENPGQVDFNDFDDFIGLDTPAMANAPAAPCQNQSVFAEDIFATEPVMLPSSATTSPAVFIDSFLDAFGGNTEATIVTAPPADDSWLDDFLG